MEDLQEYMLSLNPPISEANLEIMRRVDLNPRTLRLPKEEIVKALTEEGMSRISALDIATTALEYLQLQEDCRSHPLGIFWDIENLRIPKDISGDVISDLLKRAVRPMGNPVVCNAYFDSSDKATIAPVKKQKLQQCGWNLMDVAHCFKKEVADKVIIVDILLFILDHTARVSESGSESSDRQPVTVCLVSDDNDFSYLLAKLKAYSNVKTVIISKNRDLLAQNADVSMRWDVDILKRPVLPNAQPAPPDLSRLTLHAAPIPSPQRRASAPSTEASAVVQARAAADRESPEKSGYIRKSLVGLRLREMNPGAFGDKEVRTAIFDKALADGIIFQEGSRGNVSVKLIGRR
eukprot:gene16010-11457_t